MRRKAPNPNLLLPAPYFKKKMTLCHILLVGGVDKYI